MNIYIGDKVISIKKLLVIITFVIILITVVIVVNTFKSSEKVNYKADYMMTEKLVENTQNTFWVIKHDLENNIVTNEEIVIDENISNTLTGYIPSQNFVSSSSTSHEEEKIVDPTRDKVELKVVEDTLSKNGMILKIIDKNEIGFDWVEEYKIQIKSNEIWEDLPYKIIPLWNDRGFALDKDGQYNQTIDWNRTYGELNNGEYRLVKKVYDNSEQKYIEFYVEFVIR